MSDTEWLSELTDDAVTQVMLGLRVGLFLIALVPVGRAGLDIHWAGNSYLPPRAQLVALAICVAVLAIELALLLRRRAWGAWRWVAIALCVLSTSVSLSALPSHRVASNADWVLGVVSWIGLVVLLDRRLWMSVAFLGGTAGMAFVNAVAHSDLSLHVLLRLTTDSVGLIGYPLCFAAAGALLRRIAGTSAATNWLIDQIRSQREVEQRYYGRLQSRFTELGSEIEGILNGLSSGALRPDDPGVQRRCALTDARLKRLFDDVDSQPTELTDRLDRYAAQAESRGTHVQLMVDDIRGPTPPSSVLNDLTEPARLALAAAPDVRIAVCGGVGQVSVIVTAYQGRFPIPSQVPTGVTHVVNNLDSDHLVVETTWTAISSR